MYRLEVFDEQMQYAASTMLDHGVTVEHDALALSAYTLTVRPIVARKGWYTHLCRDEEVISDGVISDVQADGKTMRIAVKPITAIFDVPVFSDGVISDAVTWIAEQIDLWYIQSEDAVQRRPLRLVSTMTSADCPLTVETSGTTITLSDVIIRALTTYGIVVDCRIDAADRVIDVRVYRETAEMVLESSLSNVLERDITLGDSYGAANKCVVRRMAEDEGTGELERVSYYLHPDGSVDTQDVNRITPVFWMLEDMQDGETWESDALARAKELLTPKQYDQEIVLMYRRDDRIVRPMDRRIGTRAIIWVDGIGYKSILTGIAYKQDTVTLTFGTVRVDLTKRMMLERRSQ